SNLAGYDDPRRAASRARVLDATTSLLRAGGPNAGDCRRGHRRRQRGASDAISAFRDWKRLARSGFRRVMPPTPMPPERGSLRARLTVLVVTQAELMAAAPIKQWLGWRWVATPGSRAGETAAPRSTPYGTRSRSSTLRHSTRYSTVRRPPPSWANRSNRGDRAFTRSHPAGQAQHLDRFRLPRLRASRSRWLPADTR
ncbi:MAG: TetR family transcriptional regulator, partial [Mycobacterium sp.]|nr:TetR family transcriptional regulator [Mycobacterium sp.]